MFQNGHQELRRQGGLLRSNEKIDDACKRIVGLKSGLGTKLSRRGRGRDGRGRVALAADPVAGRSKMQSSFDTSRSESTLPRLAGIRPRDRCSHLC